MSPCTLKRLWKRLCQSEVAAKKYLLKEELKIIAEGATCVDGESMLFKCARYTKKKWVKNKSTYFDIVRPDRNCGGYQSRKPSQSYDHLLLGSTRKKERKGPRVVRLLKFCRFPEWNRQFLGENSNFYSAAITHGVCQYLACFIYLGGKWP